MKILNQRQIQQKIKRLAIEILENNFDGKELILIGINNNGMTFAQLIMEELLEISDMPITLTRVHLNPAAPLTSDVEIEMPTEDLNDKCLIIVDDVANTGRTIFYALKPVFNILPLKVEVAVLIDRKHKSFPIKVDYVGLTLATTLKENINVQLANKKEQAVFLS